MSYVLPLDKHDQIIRGAYLKRGFNSEEADAATHMGYLASWHGIKTHNALKAIHLYDHFGSGNAADSGCVPGATIVKKPTRFEAALRWNANKKLGQAVAVEAMEAAMALADRYGVGIVSVDDTFHYLWGGGYVMEAANRGYIAYTNCTSTLAEVVPFGGRFPTLGTNPHSWGFPTRDSIGFPIVIDWATSTIAMGRVQQYLREGMQLPPGAAIDKDGNPTTDPANVTALLPFGAHKGYSLSLINELTAALIGGSLPSIRGQSATAPPHEKVTCNFFFQVIHPDAMDCGAFAAGRNQAENVKAVLADILGHGNENCRWPGQIEAEAARRSEKASGLLFTEAEITLFKEIADTVKIPLDIGALNQVNDE